MEGNGGNWGEMGENGGKWAKWGETWGGGGIHCKITNCMNNVYTAEKWRKRGNRGTTGEKPNDIPMFPTPSSPIFPGAADLPISSLYKNWVSSIQVGKWGKSTVSMGIRKFGYLGGVKEGWGETTSQGRRRDARAAYLPCALSTALAQTPLCRFREVNPLWMEPIF